MDFRLPALDIENVSIFSRISSKTRPSRFILFSSCNGLGGSPAGEAGGLHWTLQESNPRIGNPGPSAFRFSARDSFLASKHLL